MLSKQNIMSRKKENCKCDHELAQGRKLGIWKFLIVSSQVIKLRLLQQTFLPSLFFRLHHLFRPSSNHSSINDQIIIHYLLFYPNMVPQNIAPI